MQYLEPTITPNWHIRQLAKSIILMLVLLAIWFMPITHAACAYLDGEIFLFLNHSLLYSHYWQLICGYLNHPNETWLNILFMASVNVVGIYTLPKEQRSRAWIIVIYCWITFQLVLLTTHKIFNDWLEVERYSPSIILEPWVLLSVKLNIPDIKVFSHSSFPAGHVLVLIYWARFIALYAKRWVRTLAIITAIILTLPRMISGAHWASDIIFTIVYSNIWFILAVGTPFFAYVLNTTSKWFKFT